MNSGDENTLIALADAMRELPAVVAASGPAVADAMFDVIAKSAAAGQTAEGVTWQPTQAGTAPLRNAVAAIQKRSGPRVAQLVVTTHYALHDLGRARGGVTRSILPVRENGKIDKAVAVAVERRLVERIDRVR
jgi:hypothetical protein